ncbi:MAG: hypothetical protein ABSB29_06200 [Nitrososphaerales archaeon]|jgi:hypothetical protein
MEQREFDALKNLMMLSLLRAGVSYEAIADATDSNVKTIRNRFPMSRVVRKRENA